MSGESASAEAGAQALPGAEPAEGEAALVLTASPEAAITLGEVLPGSPAGGNQIFNIIRMVLVLAMTAAAVYGVVYFLRRAGRPSKDQRNPHLKILTSAHLGSNRYVYVVSVGTRAWLIGVGEGGVTPISEISDQETVDAMLLDDSRRAAEAAPSRFSDFRTLLGRMGGGGTPAKKGGPISAAGLRSRRERLTRL
ncbi:hypothetical protein FACS1894130_11610 [Spirochaetia bacterium]|nr:hypothetical protein FACS1894130_11610 [Spirochaetia bacterium]